MSGNWGLTPADPIQVGCDLSVDWGGCQRVVGQFESNKFTMSMIVHSRPVIPAATAGVVPSVWSAIIFGISFAVVEWRTPASAEQTQSSVSCDEAVRYWNTVDEHFNPRPQQGFPDWNLITGAWDNMVETCT